MLDAISVLNFSVYMKLKQLNVLIGQSCVDMITGP
jgi:hypothetical protein